MFLSTFPTMARNSLPLILERLVERAFVCDPTQTELDLEWLARNWNEQLSVLSLSLRIARQVKQLTCLEDCTDMVMLETINKNLANLVKLQAAQEAEKKVKQPIEVVEAVEPEELEQPASMPALDQEVELVEESISRELAGKTVGVKLLEEERDRLQTLMNKHSVKTIKAAVLLCIQKGLKLWEQES